MNESVSFISSLFPFFSHCILKFLRNYVDPKLLGGNQNCIASTKSDVYSFGVILVETIGFRCATQLEDVQFPIGPKAWVSSTCYSWSGRKTIQAYVGRR
jgi:hypothetical protein